MEAATATRRPLRRELTLAAVGLALLGALVYGPQVAHGGLYWDDWQNAANVHFAREPGLFGALDQATERPVFGYRPVLTTLLVLEYSALDTAHRIVEWYRSARARASGP